MAQEGQELFVATLNDVRHFVSVLRTVAFKPRVKVTISEAGLCFTSEESRVLLAKAYVPLNVFSSFTFNPPLDPNAPPPSSPASVDSDDPPPEPPLPPSIDIEINLVHLLECLDIFRTSKAAAAGSTKKEGEEGGGGGMFGGGFHSKKPTWADEDDDDEDDEDAEGGERGWKKSGAKGGGGQQKITAARISWGGEGELLQVILTEQGGGPTTTCQLSTSSPDEFAELDFPRLDDLALRVILQSSHLRKQLQSLEPSSEKITISSRAPGVLFYPSYSGSSSSSAFPSSSSRGSGTSSSRKKSRKADRDPGADFLIEAEGTFGGVTMLTENRKPLCVFFERNVDHVKHAYKKNLLNRSLRALSYSNKASLQLFECGLFVLQVMMAPPPPPPPDSVMDEAERELRRVEDEQRKTGELNDGIAEFTMMALGRDDDSEDERDSSS
ncbi:Rad1/Rec1/Rad17 [Mrakia frigida]|uniref:Rad1/Rec1/Rad17 n=1 Tax=Mrakia frigida TaxID=29902 RepID=UPI003FCC122C